ncbi:MAG: MBL fold metallo-hydrolase [Dehalococcoidia bacterium]|jgi:glyoxylase-like metal-dependent hydrolase (beta-lactamase superfamily II)
MKLGNNLYLYPEQGMLDCNTYIVTGSPGVIIDPGNAMYLESKLGRMRQDGIKPEDIGTIMNTHLHIDHCNANEPFKTLSGAGIALHPVQKENYEFVVIEGARTFGIEPAEFTADMVPDADRIQVNGTEWELIAAPGHSPDCVCFYNRTDRILICGDVLFNMNTGRVDLPGGNADQLKASIEGLSGLDIEYLLPGHMDILSGADNVKANFEYIKGTVFPWL